MFRRRAHMELDKVVSRRAGRNDGLEQCGGSWIMKVWVFNGRAKAVRSHL